MVAEAADPIVKRKWRRVIVLLQTSVPVASSEFREFVRMQDSRQDFEAMYDPWAGAGEVRSGVDDIDLVSLRGGQSVEAGKIS